MTLADGHNVLVDVCDEGIFRVRISPRKEFEESLMERYGCIKTDWGKVKTETVTKGSETTFATGKYSLTVNKKTGVISLKDSKGNLVIREVKLLDNNNNLCGTLRETINKKWADLNVVKNDGGIIGDDEGKFANVDKREIPGAMEICAISIKMEDGERFYGGGSTSRDHIQHRGELLRMWVTYQHTEIPMPFMMSSRGWGIYDNTTRKSFFDVGSVQKDRFNIVNAYDEADFFLMACFATSAASLVLLGEQLGQGNYDYAKALSRKLLHVGLGFSVFMAALMYICRGPFIGLFTLTDEAKLWTNRILLITALVQPLQNHNAFQVCGTMRSGGDARFAAICEVATVWVIRVPLAFFVALVLKLPIYLVALLCEAESVIKAVILYVRYRSDKWMKNMIEGM